MNNKYSKDEKSPKSALGHLSRDLILRYILVQLIFLIVLAIVFIISYNLYLASEIYNNLSFWRLFYWLPENLYIVLCIIIFIGWCLITYRFFQIPIRYLDEIIRAAEQLVTPEDTPIRLIPAMKYVEDKMNLVRQQALHNSLVAKEAEQRKNDLIVYLAHDLKTPLTSVIGYLNLLRDEPQISTEQRARYIGIALEKAERLEDLTNEFFDITRFSLAHLELERSLTDLTRMLEQVTSEFMPIFKEKDIRCRLELPLKLEYYGDLDKLARVFDNLLRNAYHYSFPNSEIVITGKDEGEEILLTFTNEGKFIPPEQLNRLFEQFFRLDNSRATNTGGAGLGLAISKQIIELHGGTIKASSSEKHITFTILLPR
ncbi:MAG TPA: HAMP domain-containing sensor histidine kinase [Ureibacillus sp.]|nr:HAMP domain-containing sensor histidine kinase [Ureibacillus sp.]